MPRESLSLYLHYPFCQVRCAYCDFNTYAGQGDLMAPYARALAREIRLVGQAAAAAHGAPPTVGTVFYGGGTPSLLPLPWHAEVMRALREAFHLAPDCEITLEANPGTVDQAYLDGLRALGFNRLSFGVQSAHAAELRLLDRLHTFDDVAAAVGMARAAGFDASARGLNLDLIFALPHQTLPMWAASLEAVLALRPEHLSLYALSLEHGTPMRAWVYRGLLPMPDPDLAAEMYACAGQALAALGFVQYEISNWAHVCEVRSEVRSQRSEDPNSDIRLLTSDFYTCQHNLQYWRNGPYLGFGAGAHGSLPPSYARGEAGWRYSNVLAPAAYIARLDAGEAREYPFSPAMVEAAPVTRPTEMDETLLLGMRLVREGVRAADFEARFGVSLAEAYGPRLRRLQQLGLIEWDGDGARLRPEARLLANRVFREFV